MSSVFFIDNWIIVEPPPVEDDPIVTPWYPLGYSGYLGYRYRGIASCGIHECYQSIIVLSAIMTQIFREQPPAFLSESQQEIYKFFLYLICNMSLI